MANRMKRMDWGGRPSPLHLLARSSRPLAPELSADLLATIHEQIIPQLVLAHAAQSSNPADARLPPTQDEVRELARIAVEGDLACALEFVGSIADQGVSEEAVLLLLVAPAARLLGDQWLAEVCTFTQVTAGLDVIHQVIRLLRSSSGEDGHST
jgi:methanogenic corrinoid protein MtbC1